MRRLQSRPILRRPDGKETPKHLLPNHVVEPGVLTARSRSTNGTDRWTWGHAKWGGGWVEARQRPPIHQSVSLARYCRRLRQRILRTRSEANRTLHNLRFEQAGNSWFPLAPGFGKVAATRLPCYPLRPRPANVVARCSNASLFVHAPPEEVLATGSVSMMCRVGEALSRIVTMPRWTGVA